MEAAPDRPLNHEWEVAATIKVPENVARHADFRGSFRVKEGQRIEALETYCGACRRPFEDVSGDPCTAPVNNEHLRGGPIGERKKRNTPVFDPDAPGVEYVRGPMVNRRGVNAYVGE